MDEYNRERLQAHHFAPQQCKDFYKNVDVDPKFRDCPLRTGVPMWREFETCLNRDGWIDGITMSNLYGQVPQRTFSQEANT